MVLTSVPCVGREQMCSVFTRHQLRSARLNISNYRSKCQQRAARAALTQNDLDQRLYFVAMNNFKVKTDRSTDFENVWKNRKSTLLETPGFIRFALLKGVEEGEYISESVWASRKDFDNWRESQKFAQAHGGGEEKEKKPVGPAASQTGEMLMGPPKPRFYEAVTVTEQTLF